MTTAVRVDSKARIIEVRLSGRVSLEEVFAFLGEVESDPGYAADFDAVLDARGIVVDFDTAVLQGLAGHHRLHAEGTPSRWAMIVSEDLTYGLGRMFEAFMDESPRVFRVFRSMQDALEWLGVDVSALTLLSAEPG